MTRLRQFYEVPREGWVLSPASSSARDESSDECPVENVRQWLATELLISYGYPETWAGRRITPTCFDSAFADSSQVLGLSVNTVDGNAFLLGVATAKGKAQLGEAVLREALQSSRTAGQGVATDGTLPGTVFLRRRFDTAKCDYIPDLEPYAKKANTPGSSPGLDLEGQRLHTLVPLSERIEDLFFELHSYIRDIDGLHADESLDELCKVLYLKLYDEEKAQNSGTPKLHKRRFGSVEEMAAEARALYEEANAYDVRVFKLRVPQYERSRGVFSSPLRLSSSATAKVLEALQDYTLTGSDADIKGRAFQRVLAPAIRSGMGQYFTPEPVVRLMVETIGPTPSELVLDPFCGSAQFLARSLQHVRGIATAAGASALHEYAFTRLHGIEKSDRMTRVAMTDMRLHGDGHSNIRCTDSLLDFTNYPDLEADSFDVVLTNPPFGSLLGQESLRQLGPFELAAGRKRVPLEILGLERCLQFLRPGGRMGIVLPDSVLTNRGTEYVRDWLGQSAKVRAIVSLPIVTFVPFGANVKTSVLFLKKWERGEVRTTCYPVCLVRIDGVGYDANGRPNATRDIEEATAALKAFFSREGW